MARVQFVNDDLVVDVPDDTPAIDVCRDAGSSVPFGCTNGVCGTCVTKIVRGKEHLSALGDRERQTLEMFGALDGDHRLLCQCRVLGDVTFDDP